MKKKSQRKNKIESFFRGKVLEKKTVVESSRLVELQRGLSSINGRISLLVSYFESEAVYELEIEMV